MVDKINLVITCYDGPRRQTFNNSASNLLLHNYALNNYKHNVKMVTYVCTSYDVFCNEFMYALEIIRKTAKYNFEILFRENIGASYGSFSSVFGRNKNDYDFFIFLEDDYIISLDNFDQYLLSRYYLSEKCGFLCSFADKTNAPHASISIGLLPKQVLMNIWDKKKKLAFASSNEYRGLNGHEFSGQIQFSLDILDLGYSIFDTSFDFDSWFLGSQNDDETIVKFNSGVGKQLFIPAQCFIDLKLDEHGFNNNFLIQNDRLSDHYNYNISSIGFSKLKYLNYYLDGNISDIL